MTPSSVRAAASAGMRATFANASLSRPSNSPTSASTSAALPPLPHVTPHTLRRTYVSIMLLATNFDVTYVQHQVGHAESRMTLDVYSQLLDRQKRDHGVAFDALLADARSTLYGSQNEGFGPPFGPLSPDKPNPASEPSEQTSSFAGPFETRPARFELATSRSGGERSIH
jgi:hypothetical protein